jgi:hypothetical protein
MCLRASELQRESLSCGAVPARGPYAVHVVRVVRDAVVLHRGSHGTPLGS